jgi:hypothetical protein
MSKMQLGLDYETQIVARWHEQHTPVLISPMLLRRLGAGQIDLAVMDENKITLGEVKKSRAFLSKAQKQRLQRSQEFLAYVFEKDVVLRVL